MALTFDPDPAPRASLGDVMERVRQELDPRDDDCLASFAPALRALSNERKCVVDTLTRDLLDWQTFQGKNRYTAQSFLLGDCGRAYLRANVWTPRAEVALPESLANPLFNYQIPHDHNFSFLTVGYYGPGYATAIYEREPASSGLRPGDRIEPRFLERTTLPMHKVMMYRRHRDVHYQDPPEAFSLSINLIPRHPEIRVREQLYFDRDTWAIRAVHGIGVQERVALCEAAGYLGDDGAASALEEVAAEHPCRQTRLSAFEALARLAPAARSAVWRRALDDRDIFVRDWAARALEGESPAPAPL